MSASARAALLVALAAVAPGCLGFHLERLPGCEWIALAATPSPRDPELLALEVKARNCGPHTATLDDAGCVAAFELYPRLEVGGAEYVVLGGAAVRPEDAPCEPNLPDPRVDPQQTSSVRTFWDGRLRHAPDDVRDAPPGEHALTSSAFGREATVRVTLLPNGTFAEARA